MPDPVRINVTEARAKVAAGKALLVCAYDSQEKFERVRIAEALSLQEFRSRQDEGLSLSQPIIFYCA